MPKTVSLRHKEAVSSCGTDSLQEELQDNGVSLLSNRESQSSKRFVLHICEALLRTVKSISKENERNALLTLSPANVAKLPFMSDPV